MFVSQEPGVSLVYGEPPYFEYGTDEVDYLSSKDKALAQVITRIGHIYRPVIPDLFEALVNSIVGQQISSAALATVWGRMQQRFSPLTPEHLLAIPDEELQSCGITFKKVAYIKGAAERVATGGLDLAALQLAPDDEVIRSLVSLPGIGTWTAEMLMTFSMQRPDVISYGDLAILRGMRMVYRHRRMTPELFAKYRRRLSPYCTVASLYFWAVSGGAIPDLTDPAPKAKSKVKTLSNGKVRNS